MCVGIHIKLISKEKVDLSLPQGHTSLNEINSICVFIMLILVKFFFYQNRFKHELPKKKIKIIQY